MTADDDQVEHLADDCRFRIAAPGGGHDLAVVEYDDTSPGVWVVHHTWTDPAYRGRGLADRVVTAAMDAARAAGVRVVPTCSYAAGWLAGHPDYADLTRRAP